MKFKHLLVAAAAVSALSSSAAIDVTLFPVGNRNDIVQSGYDENGVFVYQSDGVYRGDFDEDGNRKGDYGNSIIGINKFELPSQGRYVLAFDYTIDLPIFNKMGVRRTWDDATTITSAGMDLNERFEVNDTWLTYYVPFIDTAVWDWVAESWVVNDQGQETLQPYMILDQSYSNGADGPFTLCIKNARVLTEEEAIAEVFASSQEQPEDIFAFHGLLEEYDEFAEANCFIFHQDLALNEDGSYAEQAIIGTEKRIIPINPKNNHFTFEYSVAEGFNIHVFAVMEGTEWFAREIGQIALEGVGLEEVGYDDTFATAQVDLSELIDNDKFGGYFGSPNYLWLQCYESPVDNPLFVRNPRWAPKAGDSAISNIAADANGEAVYYNLQGIRVNNPANGLFIKVEGGKTTKEVK